MNCAKCNKVEPKGNICHIFDTKLCPRCYAEFRVQESMSHGMTFTDKDLWAIAEGREHVDVVIASKRAGLR